VGGKRDQAIACVLARDNHVVVLMSRIAGHLEVTAHRWFDG
jgi:hypothetical protein